MKKTQIFYLLIFFFTISLSSYAQNGIEWQKCLGYQREDRASDMLRLSNGNLIIAANVDSCGGDWPCMYSYGMGDVGIMMLDSLGNIIWVRQYGGNKNDAVGSIIKDKRKNRFYVVGSTVSTEGVTNFHSSPNVPIPKPDAWAFCIDSVGNLLWERCYGGIGEEVFFDVTQLGDTNKIYAIGTTRGFQASGDIDGNYDVNYLTFDSWLVEIDANTGYLIKSKRLGGSSVDALVGIQAADDKSMVLVGSTISTDHDIWQSYGSGDGWFVKVDTALNIVWNKILGTNGADYLRQIINTNDKGFLVYGHTNVQSPVNGTLNFTCLPTNDELFLVKYDSLGNEKWQNHYGGTTGTNMTGMGFHTLVETADHGFIFVSVTNKWINFATYPEPNGFMVLIKTDSTGNQLYTRRYGTGNFNDATFVMAIVPTDDNGIITFSSTILGPIMSCYNSPSQFGTTNKLLWLFKLGTNMAIDSKEAITNIFSIFPNPAQSKITLDLGSQVRKIETLNIYNITGQKVLSLSNVKAKEPIDISSLKVGIFLVEAILENWESFAVKLVKE